MWNGFCMVGVTGRQFCSEDSFMDKNIIDHERQEELNRLRAKLEAAETGRLTGTPTYTLEETFLEVEKILSAGPEEPKESQFESEEFADTATCRKLASDW
jgi:hypothetical protein